MLSSPCGSNGVCACRCLTHCLFPVCQVTILSCVTEAFNALMAEAKNRVRPCLPAVLREDTMSDTGAMADPRGPARPEDRYVVSSPYYSIIPLLHLIINLSLSVIIVAVLIWQVRHLPHDHHGCLDVCAPRGCIFVYACCTVSHHSCRDSKSEIRRECNQRRYTMAQLLASLSALHDLLQGTLLAESMQSAFFDQLFFFIGASVWNDFIQV